MLRVPAERALLVSLLMGAICLLASCEHQWHILHSRRRDRVRCIGPCKPQLND